MKIGKFVHSKLAFSSMFGDVRQYRALRTELKYWNVCFNVCCYAMPCDAMMYILHVYTPLSGVYTCSMYIIEF